MMIYEDENMNVMRFIERPFLVNIWHSFLSPYRLSRFVSIFVYAAAFVAPSISLQRIYCLCICIAYDINHYYSKRNLNTQYEIYKYIESYQLDLSILNTLNFLIVDHHS